MPLWCSCPSPKRGLHVFTDTVLTVCPPPASIFISGPGCVLTWEESQPHYRPQNFKGVPLREVIEALTAQKETASVLRIHWEKLVYKYTQRKKSYHPYVNGSRLSVIFVWLPLNKNKKKARAHKPYRDRFRAPSATTVRAKALRVKTIAPSAFRGGIVCRGRWNRLTARVGSTALPVRTKGQHKRELG